MRNDKGPKARRQRQALSASHRLDKGHLGRVEAQLAGLRTEIAFGPHRVLSVSRLIDAWLPLTCAVNGLNRSMGLSDLYPFVIPPAVAEKMSYIHGRVHRQREE
jgi:hypothetical protein